MSSNRSAKSRSLGLSTKQPTNAPSRPSLGERHKSAPSVPRKQQESTSRAVDADHGAHTRSRKHSSARSSNPQSDSAHTEHQIDEGTDAKSNVKSSRKHSTTSNPFLKLVVVGNSRAGKSTFIRHALELRSIGSSPVSSSWVSLRGIVYRVQMIELPLTQVEIQDGHHVQWPKYVDKVPFNSPDAVICLYDVAKKESLDGVPQFLTALANLDIPVQLIPLRIDKSALASEPGLSFADQVQDRLPHVRVADLEPTMSQAAQRSMLVALRAVLTTASSDSDVTPRDNYGANERGRFDETDSSNATPVPATASKLTDDVSSISSETEEDGSDSEEEGVEHSRTSTSTKMLTHLQISTVDTLPKTNQAPQTPISESGPYAVSSFSPTRKGFPEAPHTPESYPNSIMRRPGTADTTDSQAHRTFFYGGEDSSEDQDADNPSSHKSVNTQSQSTTAPGVPFAGLVDQLLRMPATKHESKFVPTFLCLYRAFATPASLLDTFIQRFESVQRSEDTQFNKLAELLRYLQIMATWTATYPGDFSDQGVREAALDFVRDIESHQNLSSSAKEISNNLQVYIEDEDAAWAYHGNGVGPGARSRNGSVSVDPYEDDDDDDEDDDTAESDTDDELRQMRSSFGNSGTASTVSSLLKPPPVSSQSATNLAVLDNARDQARKLRSVPHIGLSKLQWHFFMDTSTEDLARELTRVDWIRYAAIRPRDFVRDVSLAGPNHTDTNISLMVKHFNQISFFVAGMILLRDKPKHRAKTVEKVMDLAWKVRQLNDYNCVSAIVAGMQNTAVTRLNQTMELVPTETQRQFMRLNILVDATKSYATYRIAWENTSSPRIPLIPSLRRDLKVASLANPTFLGDNVNWKKFEIMGDAIISIQKSQETPYTFPDKTQQVQDIMRLFLETKIIEHSDDTVDPAKELYDRSKQVEPQTTSSETKKRFDWLRR